MDGAYSNDFATVSEVGSSCGGHSYGNYCGCAFGPVIGDAMKTLEFSSDCYRYDAIPVVGVAFYYIHGGFPDCDAGCQSDGSGCPTDGYAISGHFVTDTHATGLIKFAYGCSVTREFSFTADWVAAIP
jgi:hypothetical protein